MLTSYDIAHMQAKLAFLMEQAAQEDADPQLFDEMDRLYLELEGAVPDKLLALRAVCVRTDAEIAVIDDEIAILRAAKTARQKTIDRVKGYCMQLLEGNEAAHHSSQVKAGGHTFWIANGERMVYPDDLADWPEEYIREKVVRSADKAGAKKALNGVDELPAGFSREPTRSVRWR